MNSLRQILDSLYFMLLYHSECIALFQREGKKRTEIKHDNSLAFV